MFNNIRRVQPRFFASTSTLSSSRAPMPSPRALTRMNSSEMYPSGHYGSGRAPSAPQHIPALLHLFPWPRTRHGFHRPGTASTRCRCVPGSFGVSAVISANHPSSRTISPIPATSLSSAIHISIPCLLPFRVIPFILHKNVQPFHLWLFFLTYLTADNYSNKPLLNPTACLTIPSPANRLHAVPGFRLRVPQPVGLP